MATITTDAAELLSVGGLIQNLGPDDLYVEDLASVDSDNGTLVVSGDAIAVGAGSVFYGVSEGSSDVRVLGRAAGLFKGAVIPGQLLSVNQYAPGTRATPTVSSTTLAAFDSGVICTGTFIAPSSGAVLVKLSAIFEQSTDADDVMLALTDVGTITPVRGFTQTLALNGATTPDLETPEFYINDLTPGEEYQFDLVGAATSTTTAKIYAQGLTALTLGNVGGPVIMSVYSAL